MKPVKLIHTPSAPGLNSLAASLREELDHGVLPVWLAMRDRVAGGFFCWQRQDGSIDTEGDKSTLLHARILYSFARAYRVTGDVRYRDAARHAYDWLTRFAVHGDRAIWSTDRQGRVTDSLNHMYNQGFIIYAFSAWARACDDKAARDDARDRALALWESVEEHAADPVHGGYFEAFDDRWQPIPNDRLCDTEDGVVTEKSMNTHLHLLEAWTELYRVAPDDRLASRMAHLIDVLTGPLLDPGRHSFHLFTAADWTVHSASRSFGHDIEGSWLIWEAARLLSSAVQDAVRPTVIAMAEQVQTGLENEGALWNEQRRNGEVDRSRVWWVQAEAVLGFINTFELTDDAAWLKHAQATWAFINQYQRDPNGEWFWQLDEHNRPDPDAWRIEPWKCPYHNGRMCLEVIERAQR